jgi:hypothetical protein
LWPDDSKFATRPQLRGEKVGRRVEDAKGRDEVGYDCREESETEWMGHVRVVVHGLFGYLCCAGVIVVGRSKMDD